MHIPICFASLESPQKVEGSSNATAYVVALVIVLVAVLVISVVTITILAVFLILKHKKQRRFLDLR